MLPTLPNCDSRSAAIEIESAHVRRGQYLGACIAVFGMACAVVAVALRGSWQVSVALVGAPIFGAVRVIVEGRRNP